MDRNRKLPANIVAIFVAPFTGAWIETAIVTKAFPGRPGRSLHRGVDRNTYQWRKAAVNIGSLPSRGRGSKLYVADGKVIMSDVAPFTGAWIETAGCGRQRYRGSGSLPSIAAAVKDAPCRSLHGGVDRNFFGG